MPNWTNVPPSDTEQRFLPLRRTPAATPLIAIATSQDLIGCPTHFLHSRTVPCTHPECEPCRTGHSWRWHAYLAAVDQKTNQHFVFECTAQVAAEFVHYRERHATLRGCLFEATRHMNRKNGRVFLRTRPADLEKMNLPQPPDVAATMAHIWSLPTKAVSVVEIQRGQGRIAVPPKTADSVGGNNRTASIPKEPVNGT